MKKIVNVQEVEGEGLVGLLGQNIMVFCMNYIYTGVLTGVNNTCILLDKAKVVYETGDFSSKKWTDAQPLPNAAYIQLSSIEMFTVIEKE